MKTFPCRFPARLVPAILILILWFGSVQSRAGVHASPIANDIQVSNVEELYAAVNDPMNVGARVVLLPGVYVLSPLDPQGNTRPNAGRLELQADMSLAGVEGDRAAAVIEAIGLPPSSLNGGPVPLAAIRIGRGHNAIEWLTVRNGRSGQGNIITTLNNGNTAYIRVAHVASTGAGNNLSIGNFGAAAAGRTLEVDISDSDLFEGTVGFRQGFRIGNFAGANGGVVNVRLNGNRIWGGGFNLIINNAVSGSAINVFSSGNHYFDNGAGLVVVGGIGGATGNTINYSGHGDRFTSNDEALEVDRGGLLFFAGDRPFVTSTLGASGNTIDAKLFGCRMEGNADVDILAVGGRSVVPSFISTVFENRVVLEIKGMPRNGEMVEFFSDSLPSTSLPSNSVTVIR